jgi:hypothetical protein
MKCAPSSTPGRLAGCVASSWKDFTPGQFCALFQLADLGGAPITYLPFMALLKKHDGGTVYSTKDKKDFQLGISWLKHAHCFPMILNGNEWNLFSVQTGKTALSTDPKKN